MFITYQHRKTSERKRERVCVCVRERETERERERETMRIKHFASVNIYKYMALNVYMYYLFIHKCSHSSIAYVASSWLHIFIVDVCGSLRFSLMKITIGVTVLGTLRHAFFVSNSNRKKTLELLNGS